MRFQHRRKTHIHMHHSTRCPIDPANSTCTHSKSSNRTSPNLYSHRWGYFGAPSGNSPLSIKSISTQIISQRLTRPHAEKQVLVAQESKTGNLPLAQQKCCLVFSSYLHSNSLGQQLGALSGFVHDVVPAGQVTAASAHPPRVESRGLSDCATLLAKRVSPLTRLLSNMKTTASLLIVAIANTSYKDLIDSGQL
jgi:hypothetical protein